MEKLTRQQQSEQTYKRFIEKITDIIVKGCLLYTSDAADD